MIGRILVTWRQKRREQQALDDVRVMTWLEDHEDGASLEEMLEHLPMGSRRLQDALERLERDGIIRGQHEGERVVYRRTRDNEFKYGGVDEEDPMNVPPGSDV